VQSIASVCRPERPRPTCRCGSDYLAGEIDRASPKVVSASKWPVAKLCKIPIEMKPLQIPEVKLLKLDRFSDSRGFFCEMFKRTAHPAVDFVQDNLSVSVKRGTVRGLHYQAPPFAQTKLVTVLRGAVFDVAVDIRKRSPTFGRWVGVELSEGELNQLLIPPGFAHGFCTLAPDTMVLYKVDAYYSPRHDRGILWNDPSLGIAWPVGPAEAILSDKDGRLPPLSAVDSPFAYDR
jgi:dTDP-4-dehydrorhamnose 3,5-epimerase